MTARIARDVDDLSGGRLTLGLVAGWQEREHANFGCDLLDVSKRFARFQEALEVITRLLRSAKPVSFTGPYCHLHEAILLPRPKRAGGPPILIGGNGLRQMLPLVDTTPASGTPSLSPLLAGSNSTRGWTSCCEQVVGNRAL